MHGRKYNFSSGKAYPFTCSHHDCEKLLASQTQTTHAFLLDHACVSLGSKCHWIYVTEDHDKQSMKICCSVSGYSQSGLPCCPHWRKSHGEKFTSGFKDREREESNTGYFVKGLSARFSNSELTGYHFFLFFLSDNREVSSAPHREEDENPTGSLVEAGLRNFIRSILQH